MTTFFETLIATQAAGLAQPPPPFEGTSGVAGLIDGDMDALHLSAFLDGDVENTASQFRVTGANGDLLQIVGSGLTYLEDDDLVYGITGGLVEGVAIVSASFQMTISFPPAARASASALSNWATSDATQAAFQSLLAGDDNLYGGPRAGVLRGYAGNDLLRGMGGSDAIWGGAGNDVIYATAGPGVQVWPAGPTYLRGEEGDDWIQGASGFDDINGNMGNDTAGGGLGDDWVVGGKDSDLLFGDAGNDLVYGNLGNDTCDGGDGNDAIRGGQDNDVVQGGAGDDYVSGDRGDDTMTGGAGADIFHSFGEAGIDRVIDFSLAQGDRVQLDPGTQYTVAQVGADTVISMTGGGQMILVGVSMASLTPGWIFGA